ncbi:hypothetical protein [Streptomyces sp. NPDC002889]|uniref:hypothetical protein n=1 Tax=Streptomyces sp. NPDC002889 TaxID=3364669 RepID=UPI003691B63B
MARISAPARWQRVHTSTAPAPATAPPGSSPIYEQLAREWAAAGRTLPGRPDSEWTRLTLFPPPPVDETVPPASRRGWLYDRHTA